MGTPVSPAESSSARSSTSAAAPVLDKPSLKGLLDRIQEVPFSPMPDSLLSDPSHSHDAPTEEFRTLRTRLNHIQGQTAIRSVVVSSASPAEGKSFAAANLALSQAQLANNMTLLADFDFRRPIVHTLFNIDRSPGITDYLLGKAQLHEIIKKIAATNLCVLPAGEAVVNPLELLNLKEVKQLIDDLPTVFNWVILDSPPLLFAADANLLSTLCHGTILVVRIGHTTIDSVSRAVNSLCQDNVIGCVVNGARRGELYSKYTYYHTYYAPNDAFEAEAAKAALPEEDQ
jgi:receptor protein-tyrosine kinase